MSKEGRSRKVRNLLLSRVAHTDKVAVRHGVLAASVLKVEMLVNDEAAPGLLQERTSVLNAPPAGPLGAAQEHAC